MSTLKQDDAGLADIANKPEVTASEKPKAMRADAGKMPVSSAHDARMDARMDDIEPDEFEARIGRVIAKSGAKMKKEAGGEADEDFFGLFGDTFSSLFAFIRCMGAPAWIRPVLGVVGLVAAMSPAILAYMRNKEAKEAEKP